MNTGSIKSGATKKGTPPSFLVKEVNKSGEKAPTKPVSMPVTKDPTGKEKDGEKKSPSEVKAGADDTTKEGK